ncbi:SDR family NAD(P)-dependent oxidoreductase [Streptomyces sp. SGAir0957]
MTHHPAPTAREPWKGTQNTDLNLNGKRALVTGSSVGLGEATAKLLAAEGAAIVVHGRDEERAEKVAREIREAGGSATAVLGDLSDDASAAEVARAATADGPVDILVNNAGFYRQLSWTEATPDEWRDTYNVNVVSGVRMIQHLVPAMRARGWGRVVTIGGGLASQPMNTHPQYNATLAARHNLAVSLARDLKGTGVTSNVVSPGAVLVDATKELVTQIGPARGWGDTWEEIRPHAVDALIPNDQERFGEPDEIAAAVAYLCSGYAQYISGATIRVDGGLIRSAF